MQVMKKDTGRIYAMKVLKKSTVIAADAVQHTLSETSVLRRVNHPFIVSYVISKALICVVASLSLSLCVCVCVCVCVCGWVCSCAHLIVNQWSFMMSWVT